MTVALTGLLAGSSAFAAEAPAGWQHTVFVYGMGASIDGEAQIGPIEVAVDVGMSDVFDALEFGAMAAYRADNGTWSFTADATFMGLGGHGTHDTPLGGQVKGEIDVDQITLMGTFGRRWTDHLEFLFGLAYVDLSMDLSVQSASGGPLDVAASRDADWIDPTLGLRYDRPLGDDWRVVLRGDIGGFGVGSDFMYHLLAGAAGRPRTLSTCSSAIGSSATTTRRARTRTTCASTSPSRARCSEWASRSETTCRREPET